MWVREHVFIGGRWVAPGTDQHIAVISPHSEERVGRVAGPAPRRSTARSTRPATPWTRDRGRVPIRPSVSR